MFYILFILKWVLVGGGGGGGERELENDISPLCELLIGTNRVVHVCSISASPAPSTHGHGRVYTTIVGFSWQGEGNAAADKRAALPLTEKYIHNYT